MDEATLEAFNGTYLIKKKNSQDNPAKQDIRFLFHKSIHNYEKLKKN